MSRDPVAVLISDVHYSLQTLDLADTVMRQAIAAANSLEVPLIVAGDLHDTKANMRAECVNALLDTFKLCETACFILVGNHDKINEKSESHALNFLNKQAEVIFEPQFTNEISCNGMSLHFIPYQHNLTVLRSYLAKVDKNSTIIMHQGIEGSHSGDYIQDKTALSHNDIRNFNVISGHYHRRQTIKTSDANTWTYIGNPYTLSFAEAEDPSKGFEILYNDGSTKHVDTNFRAHKVIEFDLTKELLKPRSLSKAVKDNDILWVKIKGPSDELARLTKADITKIIEVVQPYRLDMIPSDPGVANIPTETVTSQESILDSLIESLANVTQERKNRLKSMWKDFAKKE